MISRRTLYLWLEPATVGAKVSRSLDLFLMVMIALNVLAVMLESVASFKAEWGSVLMVFEIFSVAVFTLEYLGRVWCSVEDFELKDKGPIKGRLLYMIRPMSLIDLLAILPFYFGAFFELDLRFLWVARLVRVLKLTRYSSAMTILGDVLKQEARVFGAALFILFLLLIFAASMMYHFEHSAQPEAFDSIPKTMWWAVVTLTTVGYGDVYPVTIGGKIFGAVISILGVGMVALPAGIISSGFADQVGLRKKAYEEKVKAVLEDDLVTEEDVVVLDMVKDELGLSTAEASAILRAAMDEAPEPKACPHCGGPLHDGSEGYWRV